MGMMFLNDNFTLTFQKSNYTISFNSNRRGIRRNVRFQILTAKDYTLILGMPVKVLGSGRNQRGIKVGSAKKEREIGYPPNLELKRGDRLYKHKHTPSQKGVNMEKG
uniref:Uncharacterized protein n=1 Tax=Lactuca sativa TaxID=4236 RepID=A0A9R1VN35_LACSA|nr:hypothetical protein LSAT_V11C500286880 [Lactuca sativa]